ncbi:MAG: hypothetical protein FWG11_03015 [Promicromonosporaceae bacterium]|nr:hypothetical protein [Promicromonosporaceae bacterium]
MEDPDLATFPVTATHASTITVTWSASEAGSANGQVEHELTVPVYDASPVDDQATIQFLEADGMTWRSAGTWSPLTGAPAATPTVVDLDPYALVLRAPGLGTPGMECSPWFTATVRAVDDPEAETPKVLALHEHEDAGATGDASGHCADSDSLGRLSVFDREPFVIITHVTADATFHVDYDWQIAKTVSPESSAAAPIWARPGAAVGLDYTVTVTAEAQPEPVVITGEVTVKNPSATALPLSALTLTVDSVDVALAEIVDASNGDPISAVAPGQEVTLRYTVTREQFATYTDDIPVHVNVTGTGDEVIDSDFRLGLDDISRTTSNRAAVITDTFSEFDGPVDLDPEAVSILVPELNMISDDLGGFTWERPYSATRLASSAEGTQVTDTNTATASPVRGPGNPTWVEPEATSQDPAALSASVTYVIETGHSLTVTQAKPTAALTRTATWALSQEVTPVGGDTAPWTREAGPDGTAGFELTATATPTATDTDGLVTGSITVTNPSPDRDLLAVVRHALTVPGAECVLTNAATSAVSDPYVSYDPTDPFADFDREQRGEVGVVVPADGSAVATYACEIAGFQVAADYAGASVASVLWDANDAYSLPLVDPSDPLAASNFGRSTTADRPIVASAADVLGSEAFWDVTEVGKSVLVKYWSVDETWEALGGAVATTVAAGSASGWASTCNSDDEPTCTFTAYGLAPVAPHGGQPYAGTDPAATTFGAQVCAARLLDCAAGDAYSTTTELTVTDRPALGFTAQAMAGTYPVDFTWALTKSVDATGKGARPGEGATFAYELLVTPTAHPGALTVTGSFELSNPATTAWDLTDLTVTVAGVPVDTLSVSIDGGAPLDLVPAPIIAPDPAPGIPAGRPAVFEYTVTDSGFATYDPPTAGLEAGTLAASVTVADAVFTVAGAPTTPGTATLDLQSTAITRTPTHATAVLEDHFVDPEMGDTFELPGLGDQSVGLITEVLRADEILAGTPFTPGTRGIAIDVAAGAATVRYSATLGSRLAAEGETAEFRNVAAVQPVGPPAVAATTAAQLVAVSSGHDLLVTQTAPAATMDRGYNWELFQTPDVTSRQADAAGQGTFHVGVEAQATAYYVDGVVVGTITVTNPGTRALEADVHHSLSVPEMPPCALIDLANWENTSTSGVLTVPVDRQSDPEDPGTAGQARVRYVCIVDEVTDHAGTSSAWVTWDSAAAFTTADRADATDESLVRDAAAATAGEAVWSVGSTFDDYIWVDYQEQTGEPGRVPGLAFAGDGTCTTDLGVTGPTCVLAGYDLTLTLPGGGAPGAADLEHELQVFAYSGEVSRYGPWPGDTPSVTLEGRPALEVSDWNVSGAYGVDFDWEADLAVFDASEQYARPGAGATFDFEATLTPTATADSLEVTGSFNLSNPAETAWDLTDLEVQVAGQPVTELWAYLTWPPMVATLVPGPAPAVSIPAGETARFYFRATDPGFAAYHPATAALTAGTFGDVELPITLAVSEAATSGPGAAGTVLDVTDETSLSRATYHEGIVFNSAFPALGAADVFTQIRDRLSADAILAGDPHVMALPGYDWVEVTPAVGSLTYRYPATLGTALTTENASATFTNVIRLTIGGGRVYDAAHQAVTVRTGQSLSVTQAEPVATLERDYSWVLTQEVAPAYLGEPDPTTREGDSAGYASFDVITTATPSHADTGGVVTGTLTVTNPLPWEMDAAVEYTLAVPGAECALSSPAAAADSDTGEIAVVVPATGVALVAYACSVATFDAAADYIGASVAAVTWDADQAYSLPLVDLSDPDADTGIGRGAAADEPIAAADWTPSETNQTVSATYLDEFGDPQALLISGAAGPITASALGAVTSTSAAFDPYPIMLRAPALGAPGEGFTTHAATVTATSTTAVDPAGPWTSTTPTLTVLDQAPFKVSDLYAEGTYRVDFDWALTQAVSPASPAYVRPGEGADLTYTVTVTPGATAGELTVSGTFDVINPSQRPLNTSDITVEVDGVPAFLVVYLTGTPRSSIPADRTAWAYFAVTGDFGTYDDVAAALQAGTLPIAVSVAGRTTPLTGSLDLAGGEITRTSTDRLAALTSALDTPLFGGDSYAPALALLDADAILASATGTADVPYHATLGRALTSEGDAAVFESTATLVSPDAGAKTATTSLEVRTGQSLMVSAATLQGASLTRSYGWSLTASPAADSKQLAAAETHATFAQAVTVTAAGWTDSGWALSADVLVSNPNEHAAAVATVSLLASGRGEPLECAPVGSDTVTIPSADAGTPGTATVRFNCAGQGAGEVSQRQTLTAAVAWDAAALGSAASAAKAGSVKVDESDWTIDPQHPAVTVLSSLEDVAGNSTVGTTTWAPGRTATFERTLSLHGPLGAGEYHEHEHAVWFEHDDAVRDASALRVYAADAIGVTADEAGAVTDGPGEAGSESTPGSEGGPAAPGAGEPGPAAEPGIGGADQPAEGGEDDDLTLGLLETGGSWALANLLLVILTALLWVGCALAAHSDRTARGRTALRPAGTGSIGSGQIGTGQIGAGLMRTAMTAWLLGAGAVLCLAATALLLLTESFRGVMVVSDGWTVAQAILAALQAGLFLTLRHSSGGAHQHRPGNEG